MAGRKENIKALFTNTRSRVIIVFTAILLVSSIVIGLVKFHLETSSTVTSSADVTSIPSGIQSIPGALDQTAQYAALQETQNIKQAQKAAISGASAIPTIIRTQAFGEGGESVGPTEGSGGIGFSSIAQVDQSGMQRTLWIQSLRDHRCDKATIAQVLQEGADLSELKKACDCAQLKAYGYRLGDLKQVCSCGELKGIGYSAVELKNVGYTADALRICGFTSCEEHAAGFSVQDMKDAGYSDGELQGAGFDPAAILRAGGLPSGITSRDVCKAGVMPAALSRMYQSGVSAAALRRIDGVDQHQLVAAGFSADALKAAGFSAVELKCAGLTAVALKHAGFGARSLLDAGFAATAVGAAGFTPTQMQDATLELPPGVVPGDIKDLGCNVGSVKMEQQAGVSDDVITKYAVCPLQTVVVSDAAITQAGCDFTKWKLLTQSGVPLQKINTLNGCKFPTVVQLKAAGYGIKDLADAGFALQQILDAGFTPQDLMQVALSPVGIIAEGKNSSCSIAWLKTARALEVSLLVIRQVQCCASKDMLTAGYPVRDLKTAGFTAADLKNDGLDAKALKQAGFTAKDLIDACYTPQQLRLAGFSAAELKAVGVSAAELKNAGFSAAQLKDAGFNAADLKNAGFSAAQLKDAGFAEQASVGSPFSTAKQQTGINPLPTIGGDVPNANIEASNAKQLQDILTRQESQMAEQRYQQKIQQRAAVMQSAAGRTLQALNVSSTQVYVAGSVKEKSVVADEKSAISGVSDKRNSMARDELLASGNDARAQDFVIKTGDILFAVMDTSVNSDEPGPILATIVSGKLKGSRLIGSFTLPNNADKMVISFKTLSIPGYTKTISINAYAIDPNTARTALSSRTDHHYLTRYGALFASTFLEGFGNAFQSANTTISVGGTGGQTNTTISNGVGRSAMENAVIGLATLGKSWGQVAQKQMSQPTTVDVYSGTGLGILFTQDVTL